MGCAVLPEQALSWLMILSWYIIYLMIKTTIPNTQSKPAEYRIVTDFYNAIFQLDEARLFKLAVVDCTYVVHGAETWKGKSGLKKMLEAIKQSGLDQVKIDNIVADRRHAAINGIVTLKDGTQLAYAEFLTFSPEHKIKRVDAYAIPVTG